MPLYVYRMPDGTTVEELFPMGKAPSTIDVDGVVGTRDLLAELEGSSVRSGEGAFPRELWCSSVPPHRVAEARQRFPDRRFRDDGKLMVSSLKEERRILSQDGLHDFNKGAKLKKKVVQTTK